MVGVVAHFDAEPTVEMTAVQLSMAKIVYQASGASSCRFDDAKFRVNCSVQAALLSLFVESLNDNEI